MLQTHASAIFSVLAFILTGFRQPTLIRYVCIFVLISFQKRFQIDAFTMKTLSVLLLVWTEGLDASNYTVCVFKRIRISVCGLGLNLYKISFLPAMKNVTKSSNISSIPTPGIFSVIEINKEYD